MKRPEIQRIMQENVQIAIANFTAATRGPQGPQGPQGPAGADGAAAQESSKPKLKSKDIGLFNPEGLVQNNVHILGRHTVYNDMIIFIDRVRDMVHQYSEETIRPLLHGCLKGKAEKWISTEIARDSRLLIMTINSEQWLERLVKRFAMQAHDTQWKLSTCKFGFE